MWTCVHDVSQTSLALCKPFALKETFSLFEGTGGRLEDSLTFQIRHSREAALAFVIPTYGFHAALAVVLIRVRDSLVYSDVKVGQVESQLRYLKVDTGTDLVKS